MRFFTTFLTALLLLALTLAPSFAANITILVGNNYYHGPGNTTSDADVRTIRVGDVVTWTWVAGVHPTKFDNNEFAPFPMSSGSPSKTITFTAVGVFPYHCEAHGAPGFAQYGRITVALATATLDPRAAGIDLAVYPNPSRGQVTVQLNQKVGADYKLRLSNIIGQEIRTVALKPELTTAGLPLDLSDLRAGMYFYSLLVDGKVMTTKRLVLQN